jgi:GNAT superfamily N-acetyltransferase
MAKTEKNISKLNELAWNTEISLHGHLNATKPQWAMWLDLPAAIEGDGKTIELREVVSDGDWHELARVRTEIEVPFYVVDPLAIARLIERIRKLVRKFKAPWYFAVADGEIVGEVGLFEFDSELGRIGRLQDVDILPRFQGRGLGNALLDAIILEAQTRNLAAICLKADADRWVKDWYMRRGFLKVGEWVP